MSNASSDGNPGTTNHVKLLDTTCGPESMGLFTLGWLVLLFALMNLRMFPMGSMLLLTVFFSGFGFIMVAYIGWKKNEMFFVWGFTLVAVFVWAFSTMVLLAQFGVKAVSGNELGWFFVIFSAFIVLMGIIATHSPSLLMPLDMFSAALLFFIGGLHSFMPTQTILQDIFGWFGLIVAGLLLYTGFAITINTVHGKARLPMLIKKHKAAAPPTKSGPANGS